MLKLTLTLALLEAGADVKLEAMEVLVVELSDSTLSAAGSVLVICGVLSLVAHEGVRAVSMSGNVDRGDVTVGAEALANIIFSPLGRKVLHVHVIVYFAELLLVTRGEFDSNELFVLSRLGESS